MNIGLIGAKGGSGTTTTAVMLFAALADMGESVTLVTDSEGFAAAGLALSHRYQNDRGMVVNRDMDPMLSVSDDVVITDGGAGTDKTFLVTKGCYLALRRAVSMDLSDFHGVILVSEMGRALREMDVERALSLPVVATIPYDPSISRSVDAGLLMFRVPMVARDAIQPLAESLRVHTSA